jgi:hypothetical protein
MVLLFVQSASTLTAQTLDIKRINNQRFRLNWHPVVGDRILQQNPNLDDPLAWDIVVGTPRQVAGNMELDRLFEGTRMYYRFGAATIIFVNGANASPGTGTFVNPFKTLALGTAEAATRFSQSGKSQVIYVFSHEYRESLFIRGTNLPGYQITVIDSSIPIAFGGRILGGDPKASIVAIDVAEIAAVSLFGFNVSGAGVPAFSVVNADRLRVSNTKLASTGGTHGIRIEKVDTADVVIEEASLSTSTASGIDITDSNGSYTFDSTTIDQTTGNGILLKNAGGNFTFSNMSVTDAGVGSGGVKIESLAARARVTYQGSITSNGGGELVSIDTTAAGSSILFDGEAGDLITGSEGGGIVIFGADGDVTVNTPTSITNAKNGFLLTGISIFGGSGVASFRDTTVRLTDNSGYNAGVEINGQSGAVNFSNLNVTTDDTTVGAVGIGVAFSNQVTVSGTENTIQSNGAAAIELLDANTIDLTFKDVTTTNTLNQAGKRNGITISDTKGGKLSVTGKTTLRGLDGSGMFVNGAAGISIRRSQRQWSWR